MALAAGLVDDIVDYIRSVRIVIVDIVLLLCLIGREEFLVEFLARIRRDVARIAAIRHDEHLHKTEQAAVFALHAVFLDLAERIHIGVVLIFQLNLDHGQAVDEQGHVKATHAVVVIDLTRHELIDDLIGRAPARNLARAHGHEVHRTLPRILAHQRDFHCDTPVVSSSMSRRSITASFSAIIFYQSLSYYSLLMSYISCTI